MPNDDLIMIVLKKEKTTNDVELLVAVVIYETVWMHSGWAFSVDEERERTVLGVYLICLGKNVKEDYYTIMYAFVGRLQILIQDRIVIAHLTQIEK